eukprot:COSAG06_NODE_1549_length_9130_cov_6.206289_4_plen_111_part_00
MAEVVAPNFALAFAAFYCWNLTRRLRYQHACAFCNARYVVQVVVPNESKELVGEASKQALEAEVAPLAAALQRSGLQPDAVYLLPVRKPYFFEPFLYKNDHFTKTGSGQT